MRTMQQRLMGVDDFLREADRLAREQAALEGRTPELDTLLPGEDPGSPLVADAARWAARYAELIERERVLLAAVSGGAEAADAEAEAELDRYRRGLELRLARLELHRRFWLDRCPAGDGELAAGTR
jgi:hypothetical protein